jgi:Na+-driven multidrug efflux pump
VRELAEQLMIIVAAIQLFQTSSVVMSGALRGAGDTRYVARVMLLTVAVMRPGLALLFTYTIGTLLGQPHIALLGCWAASLSDMTVRMTLCLRRFNGGKWHDIRV